MERANGTSRRSPSLRNAARAAEAALALLLALLVSLPWPSVVVAQDEAQGDAQSATFSPEQLEQVVAPIALYPDSLLAQVMTASTTRSRSSKRRAGRSNTLASRTRRSTTRCNRRPGTRA